MAELRTVGVMREVVGECNHCMECCKQNVFAETEAERKLLQWCPEADADNKSCKAYGWRPDVCRSFPTLYDFDAGRVPKECSYRVEERAETLPRSKGVIVQEMALTPLGNQIALTYFDGARVDIKGEKPATYRVRFLDADNDVSIYQAEIPTGHWAAPLAKYFVRWHVKVEENGVLVFDQTMDPVNKRIWISLNSTALGDSIAWLPYAEEFRKRWQAEVHVGTYLPQLFQESYPKLIFEKPGVDDPTAYYAGYLVGAWDNDYHRNKNNWREVPLQQVAADALGLPFQEVRPKIAKGTGERDIEGKYVAIAEFSTFHAKHWLYPNGWQILVDYLRDLGYQVVSISKEQSGLDNVIPRNGRRLAETIQTLQHAEFFIGVSSGLSWMAWGLNVPVIMISGFTEPFTEMVSGCYRVINKLVCTGCINDRGLPFERGSWEYCPRNKKFECSTSITPEMVQVAIDRCIADKNAGNKRSPDLIQIRNTDKSVVFLAPHCSTGGMPQYLYASVRDLLNSGYQVSVVEWADVAPDYVVQKKRIKALCPFYTLHGDKGSQLFRLLDDLRPAVVHLEEFAESFLPTHVCEMLYRERRPYRLVETTHAREVLKPENKRWRPDHFVFVSNYHLEKWRSFGVPMSVAPYQAEPHVRPDRSTALRRIGLDPARRHVLQVGLFAPWKNQAETFEIARRTPDIQFHFVGNQAPNFADYWKPLMAKKPANCMVWGEREDVDSFYAACDLFYFPSTDELNPLGVKEALAWQMRVMMRNLPTCGPDYAGNALVQFIADDVAATVSTIRQMLPSLGADLARAYEPRAEIWPIPGWFDPANQQALEDLIKKHRIRSVLEIGSFLGLSTAWFAKRVERVTCIDTWAEIADVPDWKDLAVWLRRHGLPTSDFFGHFEANMRKAGVWDKLQIIRGDSRKVHAEAEMADLVYIDADHAYPGCKSDINLYAPKARKILCGDDYVVRPGYGVVAAVDEARSRRRVNGPFWWDYTPSVAVVIPNLNYGKFLKRAILSTQSQTIPPVDIVVVDGGSTDESEMIAKECGVRWMVERKGRMARAKNVGIDSTDADWIITLDADDWISPDYIDRSVEYIADGVGIIAAGMQEEDGSTWIPAPPFTVERFLQRNLIFTTSMFRRAMWEQLGGYDEYERTYEDWDLWTRAVTAGWQIASFNDPLFHYRRHAGSNIPADIHAEYHRYMLDKHARANGATVSA